MRRFYGGIVVFVCLLLSFVVIGCSDSGSGGDNKKLTVQRTLALDPVGDPVDLGATDEVIFEVTAERGTGEPVTVTYTFDTYVSAAEIEITNGGKYEPYGEYVSSATILLNGEEIFGPNDFNQNVDEIEADITLLDGENILEVTLRSSPGSMITIEIEQEIDETQEDDGLEDDTKTE